MRISDWSSDVCSSDLEGYFTAGYGNYNRINLEGAIEVTPSPDKFGIRLAATYVDADSYIKNRLPEGPSTAAAGGASGLNFNTGRSPGGTQSYGLRLSMRWKPVDTVEDRKSTRLNSSH